MLEVASLSVAYQGAIQALHAVDLDVAAGDVVAVLGSNGAGKSTLLRAISGVIGLEGGAITGGSIRFQGRDLRKVSAHRRVPLGLAHVPEGRHVFGQLTVEENLRAGAVGNSKSGRGNALRDEVYDLFPILADRSAQRAAMLSGGEQQMLALGRALMAEPDLLMLDEPSLGLAPRIVSQVADIIRVINERGTTILLVEQNASMALGAANRAVVLELGRVLLSGDAATLSNDDRIRDLYLGRAGETEFNLTPAADFQLAPWVAS
ncbi:ABC transporter ATP-binding protein [Nocardioides pacificus]